MRQRYFFAQTTREVIDWLELSLSEIARLLEVNKATVSRALSNKTWNVTTQRAIARLLVSRATARGMKIKEGEILLAAIHEGGTAHD